MSLTFSERVPSCGFISLCMPCTVVERAKRSKEKNLYSVQCQCGSPVGRHVRVPRRVSLFLEYFQHKVCYTLCALPKARETASYTSRNSLIRESSGSAASPRVCSGDGSGGLSGTSSNPKSPTPAPCSSTRA